MQQTYWYASPEQYLDHLKVALVLRSLPCCDNFTDPAELKLSQRVREGSRREGSTKRNWFDAGSHSSSPIMIDLEDESDWNPLDQGRLHLPVHDYLDHAVIAVHHVLFLNL